jgi:hypothetical protein
MADGSTALRGGIRSLPGGANVMKIVAGAALVVGVIVLVKVLSSRSPSPTPAPENPPPEPVETLPSDGGAPPGGTG